LRFYGYLCRACQPSALQSASGGAQASILIFLPNMDKKTAWTTGLAWGGGMWIMTTAVFWLFGGNALGQALVKGAIGAAVAAPIFVWMMSRMAKNAQEQALALLEGVLAEGEALLHQSNANHFVGIEGVGGLLVLTSARLLFQSHQLNVQKHRWEAKLSDVASFQRRKTGGLIPNGLSVVLRNGEEHRFVVMGAADWEAHLAQALPPTAPA
jgi:hypothetical protein